ncbi:glycoside hydrolase family 42 [Silvibacterium dinghuense]|uniref:Glycoside hydrolase family 42 n=1 Tax=Silvibacterium dinghuense TaxID=1560006 RepID=A0A4Q1SA11_9BACT|nr:glycoside hydrolase family 42 [Silvibacterium dinghuense]
MSLLSLASVAEAQHGRSSGASHEDLPHLEQRGAATQLIVDGNPYLILGGELHNSSSSSLAYMQDVWPRMESMHLNTLLTPVAWETIEPEEGHFDFHVLDGLLEGARAHHLRLVLLWFGAWKNTFSSYAPGWVKRDEQRFPRVLLSDGRGTERLSPFSDAVRAADSKAFSALMQHLREADGDEHTVLMVQVENEVGVIPESRDHSPAAEAAFRGDVPATLTRYLEQHRSSLQPELRTAWEAAGARTSGSWQQVFGLSSLTDDLFMAWQYASYLEQIAVAGKRAYSLPMYANAALIRPNYEPGQYNSGGPLPHSMDVWRAAAPALDFLSPDIYFNEFAYWAGAYARPGNALFIPEAQPGIVGAANALYAFGRLSAVGFSAFGIDDQGNAPLDLVGITRPGERPDTTAIASVYAELSALSPLILDAQRRGSATAALVEGDAQRAARVRIGEYTAEIRRTGNEQGSRIGVLFLQQGPDTFLVAGAGDAQVVFSSDRPGAPIVGIESIDEELYEHGQWVVRRRLNGDESGQGQQLRIYPQDISDGRIYRVRLYRYH